MRAVQVGHADGAAGGLDGAARTRRSSRREAASFFAEIGLGACWRRMPDGAMTHRRPPSGQSTSPRRVFESVLIIVKCPRSATVCSADIQLRPVAWAF
jgi:hypothetical protein